MIILFLSTVTDNSSDDSISKKDFNYKPRAPEDKEDITVDTQPLDYGNFFEDVEESPTEIRQRDKKITIRSIEIIRKY